MLKIEIESHVLVHDEAIGFNRKIILKCDNIYRFNVDFNLAIMKFIVEYGNYAKAHEQDEMEKNRELPF